MIVRREGLIRVRKSEEDIEKAGFYFLGCLLGTMKRHYLSTQVLIFFGVRIGTIFVN